MKEREREREREEEKIREDEPINGSKKNRRSMSHRNQSFQSISLRNTEL
jgi:hypothetical protein